MPKEFPKELTSNFQADFAVDNFGLYAISITAGCEKNHDLKIEIDNLQFREITPEKNTQTFDIPPAWNGTKIKGLTKTVFFLLTLNKGQHTVKFFPKDRATVKSWDYRRITNPQEIRLNVEKQAEDGDRRPWNTFALVNLPLKSVAAEASIDWHLFDGDDIKLVVDNMIEKNSKSKLWKHWIWHATPKQIITGSKREKKTFTKNFPQENHYIEFWADKTPTLHHVTFDLGDYTPKRMPTVDDPKWTGDFSEDTDQMILGRALFGEARKTLVPDRARVAIGWVIKNRVEDDRWAGRYWEVITEPLQYSSFNNWDPNRSYVENPAHTQKEIDQKAWKHAYEIAGKVINGELQDPTKGANHYYDSIDAPGWAENQQPTLSITYTNEYEKEVSIFFFKI